MGCFNATKEDAYDDLRAMKTAVTMKIKEVVRLYEELKDITDEGTKDLDEDSRKIDYDLARTEVMGDLQNWYVTTGETIREKPGMKPAMKVKAAHAYMKKAKAYLRKTTPLGGDEEENVDKEWLEEDREAFPLTIISAEDTALWMKGSIRSGEMGIKERLRNAMGVMDVLSPRRPTEKVRTSTPED